MKNRAGAPVLLALRALGLGDLLAAVPALRALRRDFADHEVVLAAPPGLHKLAHRAEVCDRCVAVRDLAGAARALAGERGPAVAANLHGRGPQSHEALRSTSPRTVLAFTRPGWADDGPTWDGDEHERQRWCRLLAWYGIAADPADLAVEAVTAPARSAGTTIVHPGAAAGARRWPLDRWVRVARRLEADGHRVVVTGGPDERALARDLTHRAGLPPDRCVAGTTTPVDLLDLVGSARLVLSGDTGVAHVATATSTPSVVLFGPVSPARWGPPDEPFHRALWAGTSGDPHGAAPDAGLLAIEPDEVLDAVAAVVRAHACARTSRARDATATSACAGLPREATGR